MGKGKKIARRLGCGIPIAVSLFGVAAWFYTFGRVDDELTQEIAKARRLGIPTEAADLVIPSVPDAENAAPVYRKITESYNSEVSRATSALDRARDETKTSEEMADRKAASREFAPALALLHLVPARPKCQFHRDWTQGADVLLPELIPMSMSIKLLCNEAEVLSRKGDWRGALQELRIAERIGLDELSDQTLSGFYWHNACRANVRAELATIVDQHSSDQRALNAFEQALREWNHFPNPKSCVRSDIVAVQETLRGNRKFLPYAIPDDATLDSTDNSLETQFFNYPTVRTHLRARYLRYWRRIWERTSAEGADWKKFGRDTDDVSRDYGVPRTLFAGPDDHFVHSCANIVNGIVQVQSRTNLLLTSIRLLRIRNATGSLPDQLPAKLGEISVDPFINKPLHYRKEGRGFVLYSVGNDMKDDGGHLYKKGSKVYYPGRDVVVEFR